jgi:serine/threonine-protein kinase
MLEQIGAGGMGVVYRAHDERLDRDIAIKVLPPGTLTDEASRKRFRKEALALAKLNHPNIATVHDFDTQDGIDFLVMEYVRGITLAGKIGRVPLHAEEVIEIGLQLANTLADAHEHGIVHRDLKPGNIMLTAKHQVKLLDFGLAKLLNPVPSPEDITRSLSVTDTAGGTLPYMAPEQLKGEAWDFRADIYSVGAVLYEMATGRRPFEQKLPTAVVDDIIHKSPPPPRQFNPKLSPKLEDIILKCLEKEPDNRYQSSKELAVDLRRLGTPATAQVVPSSVPTAKRRWLTLAIIGAGAVLTLVLILAQMNVGGWRDWRLRVSSTPIQSLAVLPLANLSRDAEQEYFADGMTDELITALGRMGALNVISRTSVMHYKGSSKTVPEIARELHVQAVLQGSVLRSRDHVRITAQLTDAATDRNLWGQSYERNLRDVLTLQDEVAQDIVREVRIKLTAPEQKHLAGPRVVSPDAHEAYLKGRYYWNKRTPEALAKSLEYFQWAAQNDPGYALAYAGLADAYSLGPDWGLPSKEANEKSKAAALKALHIDDTLAEAHTSLAAAMWTEWDWSRAEKEFERAIELNPSYATAHHWFSIYFSTAGNHEAAIREGTRALELDPLSLIINASLGGLLFDARRYDQAIDQCRKTVDLDANFAIAHDCLGIAYVQKGKLRDAISELRRAVTLSDGSPLSLGELGYAYALSGEKSEARAVLYHLRHMPKGTYVPSYAIAVVHAGLGEKSEALVWLRRAYDDHDIELLWLQNDPMLDSLRSDARFQDLLRSIGFPNART